MTRQLKQKREEVKVVKIETPSPYGSHASMTLAGKILVDTFHRTQPTGEDKRLLPLDKCILLQDERGFYLTETTRLDTGLADPNRYSNPDARVPIKAIANAPKEGVEEAEKKLPERCDECVSKKVSVNDNPCRICFSHESKFETVKKGADKEKPTPKATEVLTTA